MKCKFYTLDGKPLEFYRSPPYFTGFVVYEGGTKTFFKNGKYHREDGPAIERPDGTKAWYINGKYIDSKEQHKLYMDLLKLKNLL